MTGVTVKTAGITLDWHASGAGTGTVPWGDEMTWSMWTWDDLHHPEGPADQVSSGCMSACHADQEDARYHPGHCVSGSLCLNLYQVNLRNM